MRLRRSVLTAAALLALSTAHAVRAQELATLKIAGAWSDDWKTILWAQRNGVFRKYGINVEIAGSSSGAAGLAGATASLAWIDQNGGDAQTGRVVELPNSAILPPIEDGRIDAATIGSPFLSQALDSGRVTLLGKSYDAIGKRFATAAWFAAPEYIAKNVAVMDRFARAMREAIVHTNAHLAETVDLVASFTGIEARIVARSVRAIDAAVKYKVIERGFDAQDLISPVALKPTR